MPNAAARTVLNRPSLTGTVFVTGADAGFFRYMCGTVLSIESALSGSVDIAVLDCGLNAEQRRWLVDRNVQVVVPGWNFQGIGEKPSWFKAMTARPFLPSWLPGRETYVWIDADAWVQDGEALELLVSACEKYEVACVPEADRAYPESVGHDPKEHGAAAYYWRFRSLEQTFGHEVAKEMARMPTLNCGVFAARARSDFWAKWQANMASALRNDTTDHFFADQSAFNVTLYRRLPSLARLPAWCNWLCCKALPFAASDGSLVEPAFPHHRLGIVHMAGETKSRSYEIKRTDGGCTSRRLHFPQDSNCPTSYWDRSPPPPRRRQADD